MEYLAPTPSQLAEILKGFRRTRKLTQEVAAQRGGLLQKTVSNLEISPARTSVESLFRLLSALDLELVVRDKRKTTQVNNETW